MHSNSRQESVPASESSTRLGVIRYLAADETVSHDSEGRCTPHGFSPS